MTDDKGPAIDVDTPHSARRYNYWLGGKDNFAADRKSGDQIEQVWPGVRIGARQNRDFRIRAIRYLTACGFTQFLDIGTGLPSPGNTHEVAQAVNPLARVVYVDNDPMVLTNARALLADGPPGSLAYIDADLRDPEAILSAPELRATLDLSRPIVLLMAAVLHFVDNDDEAYRVVKTLMDALVPGSALVLSHATLDLLPDTTFDGVYGIGTFKARTLDETTRFFDGLNQVSPGVTIVSQWHPVPPAPGGDPPPAREDVSIYGGVAIKP